MAETCSYKNINCGMFFFLEMYKEFQLLLDAKDDQKKEPYDFFIEVL